MAGHGGLNKGLGVLCNPCKRGEQYKEIITCIIVILTYQVLLCFSEAKTVDTVHISFGRCCKISFFLSGICVKVTNNSSKKCKLLGSALEFLFCFPAKQHKNILSLIIKCIVTIIFNYNPSLQGLATPAVQASAASIRILFLYGLARFWQ